MKRMFFASLAYVLTVFGASAAVNFFQLATWAKVVVAVIPTLPAVWMLLSMVSFVRSMDEVEQKVMAEATIISAGVVGIGSFTWGFIESVADVGDLELIWILPALICVQGIATPFVRRRYS
jgi:hypothetical protein